ncbi:hypothetical protein PQX77_014697 [Marasmius sp. AFHP31]|nr:hypothetical protein PQX77_014697 [Marasmius sp. AFHP31]
MHEATKARLEKEARENQAKKEAWEEVMKRVDKNDDGLEKGWKEDIDTLLVFAGLFSAVVTAFTIESYKWLSEDSSDQTVAILTHISAQLHDRNSTQFEPPRFTPSHSVVRINVFWFLSLILALIDALFGLMCKQWLREQRRPVTTETPEQWLTLRCFRTESFEQWHVPAFLASLPIILEVALFCFFAGLLELLWTKHCIPFVIAAVIVGFAITFYVATTLLPGIDIVRLHPRGISGFNPDYPDDPFFTTETKGLIVTDMRYLCPYKSPQAWAMFKLITWILGPSSPVSRLITIPLLRRKLSKTPPEGFIMFKSYADPDLHALHNIGSWASADQDVIQRFSWVDEYPNMYALKSYRWLVHEFRDIPSMIPHLQTLLRAHSPRLVMPAVLGSNIVRTDRDWNEDDVQAAWEGYSPAHADSPFRFSKVHMALLDLHYNWSFRPTPEITRTLDSLFRGDQHILTLKDRCIPLTRILHMIPQREAFANGGQDRALEYIQHFSQHYADIDTSSFDHTSVAPNLHFLARMDLGSLDFKKALVDLLVLINKSLMEEEVGSLRWAGELYPWIDGLEAFQAGQDLEKGYFAHHPSYFPISMDRMNDLLCDPITKSIAVEYMDEYRQSFDQLSTVEFLPARAAYLVTYLFENVSADPKIYPSSLQDELRPLRPYHSLDPSGSKPPHLLTSQEGLSFLRTLNKITRQWHSSDWWDSSGVLFISNRRKWELVLKCVAHINGKPLDYFSIPDSPNQSRLSSGAGPSTTRPAANVGENSTPHIDPPTLSTPTHEGGTDGTSIGEADVREAEWSNPDILEGHLFDHLILG